MKKELKIYLASPRGFCAGVKRAIEIVEKSISKFGAPVYVRHEIVHNKQVVEELKEKVTSFSNSTKRIPNLTDYMVLLAIAFGTVGLSHLGAEYISEFLTSNFEAVADKSSGLSSFASKFFWIGILHSLQLSYKILEIR